MRFLFIKSVNQQPQVMNEAGQKEVKVLRV